MAFIPVPNVAEIELQYSGPGGFLENTLYFHGAVDWTPTLLLDLATDMAGFWTDNFQGLIPAGVSLINIRAIGLASASDPAVDYSNSMPFAGTISQPTPILPSSVTLSIGFRTLLRGRSFRGRNYWPAFSAPWIGGDYVNSDLVADIVAAYTAMIDVDWPNGATWSVVSRYADNAPRVTGIATPVSSVFSDGIIDSQRRRLLGRGV